MTTGRTQRRGRVALVALLVLCAAGSARAVEVHRFANGITARIHGPGEISADLLVERAGASFLEHPLAGTLELDAGKEPWVPFDTDLVAEALEAMHGFRTRIEVDVFVLPAPPVAPASSFARRGAIFLAPGFAAADPSTIAYITTHEMGHVLTWGFMDGQADRWERYLQARGLDETIHRDDAIHADQPREILAEDLRYLFGGEPATRSGSIENHDLPLPDRVPGLAELLAGYLEGDAGRATPARAQAWPNPCNPLTTIEMTLPAGAAADGHRGALRIYDVRGALVRTVEGGVVANDRISLQWNGTDDRGAAAASGRYLYVIRLGDLTARGAVTLVR